MACRDAYRLKMQREIAKEIPKSVTKEEGPKEIERLFFGVDSATASNKLLQNNIDEFEWVVRNKIYPNFFGRYINGEKGVSKDEIRFLHSKGCKIAAIYSEKCEKQTEEHGKVIAEKVDMYAIELGIPEGTAIFLEIGEDEHASRDFMKGYAMALTNAGYTPAFKANTDAKFSFDREFSRGMQTDKDLFKNCLIWAVAPTLDEYNGMQTTHLIHPDNWRPYAPSGITRKEIAIWQYGTDCHPIWDDANKVASFNLDVILNEQIIFDKMF